MSTKNKIIISVTTVCVVAIIAIAAVIAVFAATAQTFEATFHITYSSTHVVGTAKANYIIGGTRTPLYKNGKKPDTTLEFTATDTSTTVDTLKPESSDAINLTDGNTFIVFEYIFENNGQNPFTAVLTYKDTETKDNGFTITTGKHESTELNEFSDIITPFTPGSLNEDKQVLSEEVGVGKTLYIYVKVTVTDPGVAKADFSGSFKWTLTGSEAA